MMYPIDAYIRAMEETGPTSLLSRWCEWAVATGIDLVDYDGARAQYQAGNRAEPPEWRDSGMAAKLTAAIERLGKDGK